MRNVIMGALLFCLCSPLFAEFRLWEDRNGKQFQAEFVRELFDKVTLRLKDGTETRMALAEFSEKDQGYFRTQVPPTFSVDVKAATSTKEKAWSMGDDQTFVTTITKYTVTIKKENQREFTSSLNFELFVIAKELDLERSNYVLMQISQDKFLFDPKNDNTFVFKAPAVETERYNQNGTNQLRGEEIAGYILVIRDAQGKLIETKTNIAGKWADKPELSPALKELWSRGPASKRSRHFDKTGHRVEVPRVRPFSGWYN